MMIFTWLNCCKSKVELVDGWMNRQKKAVLPGKAECRRNFYNVSISSNIDLFN